MRSSNFAHRNCAHLPLYLQDGSVALRLSSTSSCVPVPPRRPVFSSTCVIPYLVARHGRCCAPMRAAEMHCRRSCVAASGQKLQMSPLAKHGELH
jgi:hypothetical protein